VGHAVAQVDADHLRIIFREESITALFVLAAELVIIRDVAVVDRRQVGHAVRPERLRVAKIDPAFRR